MVKHSILLRWQRYGVPTIGIEVFFLLHTMFFLFFGEIPTAQKKQATHIYNVLLVAVVPKAGTDTFLQLTVY